MAGELADVVAETAPTDPLAIAPEIKGSIRILIVEDEQHLADGLKFNLDAEGYVADVVDSGEAALARLTGPAASRIASPSWRTRTTPETAAWTMATATIRLPWSAA